MGRLKQILFRQSVEPLEVFLVFHSFCIAIWQIFLIVDVSNWHLMGTYIQGVQPPVGNFIAIAALNVGRLVCISRNNLSGRVIVAAWAMMLWTASAVVRFGLYPEDREAVFYATSACGSSFVFFRLMTVWWRLREIGDADITAVSSRNGSLFTSAGYYGASGRRPEYAISGLDSQAGSQATQDKGAARRGR